MDKNRKCIFEVFINNFSSKKYKWASLQSDDRAIMDVKRNVGVLHNYDSVFALIKAEIPVDVAIEMQYKEIYNKVLLYSKIWNYQS